MRRPTRSDLRRAGSRAPGRAKARPARTRDRTGRRRPATPPPRRPTGLTGRAAILGLVLCALVVSAALPLREYLSQRSQIADVQRDQAAAAQRVADLEQQKALLQDPDHLKALARDRLHFVMPGETTYVVITPAPVPTAAPDPDQVKADARAPWFSQLWGTAQQADAPAPAPTPTP